LTTEKSIKQFLKQMNLNSNAGIVKHWMENAEQLVDPDSENQLRYVEEEFYELLHAWKNETRPEVIKEACDLLWVTYGLLHTLNVDPDQAFDRIAASNYSKFPFTKVEGKVQKGPDYEAPNLTDL